jgi:hypothetical protein
LVNGYSRPAVVVIFPDHVKERVFSCIAVLYASDTLYMRIAPSR